MNPRDLIKKLNFYTVLISLLTFVIGWQLGHRDLEIKWSTYTPTVSIENREPPKNVNVDFKLFWDIWDLLSRNYLDKSAVDPNKMFYGAISGMVAAVGDPYTVFLPPDQQKSSKEDLGGSFEGVGIELGFNDDKRLVVVAPLDGTPADKAGIKAQDVIMKINDKDTSNITLQDAVKLIRGPRGTDVTLTVLRSNIQEPKDFKLTRGTIVIKSAQAKIETTKSGQKISVIKLTRFGERTNQEWNEAVTKTVNEGAEGVVLDLRNNPGGFLDGAVFIASEFLNGGDVVLQENSDGQKSSYKVNRQGRS